MDAELKQKSEVETNIHVIIKKFFLCQQVSDLVSVITNILDILVLPNTYFIFANCIYRQLNEAVFNFVFEPDLYTMNFCY